MGDPRIKLKKKFKKKTVWGLFVGGGMFFTPRRGGGLWGGNPPLKREFLL